MTKNTICYAKKFVFLNFLHFAQKGIALIVQIPIQKN